MIIATTYFTGPIAIAQLSQPAVADNVATYIELYGTQLLNKAMGGSLAAAYLAAIEVDEPEQRWLDLKEGLSFENQSQRVRKWVGFDSGEPLPLNPVANYVWFHFQRDGKTQMAGVGSVAATAENAVNVSPSQRLSQVWNQMATDISILWEFLTVNADIYPEMVDGEVDKLHFFSRGGFKINAFGI